MGRPCLITAHHVLKPPANDPQPDNNVHQPFPPMTIGNPNLVAEFYVGEWGNFQSSDPNSRVGSIDAALCRLTEGGLESGNPLNDVLGDIGPLTGFGEVKVGDMVRKCGRTTGMTWGEVKSPGALNVIGKYGGITLNHLFYLLPRLTGGTVSAEGDSGAPIVRFNHGALIGILHGKQQIGTADVTLACYASDVVQTFGYSGDREGEGQTTQPARHFGCN
jgi:hypothetical protein